LEGVLGPISAAHGHSASRAAGRGHERVFQFFVEQDKITENEMIHIERQRNDFITNGYSDFDDVIPAGAAGRIQRERRT
jgi:hypothetical protein